MAGNAEMRAVAREGALLAGGARAILLQIAHPGVARGVAEHSDFAGRPLDRLRATLTYVYGVTFGTPEESRAVAAMVTEAHRSVAGAGYRASDPELQLWVAATLYDTALLIYEQLFGALDPAVAEKVYEQYAAGLLPDEGAGGGAPGLDAVAGGVGAPSGHEGQRPVARQRHRRQRHRDPGVPGGGQAGGGVDGGEALAGGGADGGEVAGHIDLGLVGRDPDAVDARVEVGVPGLDRSGVDRDAGQPVAGQAAEGGERAADVEAGPGQGQALDGGAGRRLPGRRDRAGGGVEPGQAVAGDAVDGVEDAAGIEPGAIGHHGVDGPVGVGHEP